MSQKETKPKVEEKPELTAEQVAKMSIEQIDAKRTELENRIKNSTNTVSKANKILRLLPKSPKPVSKKAEVSEIEKKAKTVAKKIKDKKPEDNVTGSLDAVKKAIDSLPKSTDKMQGYHVPRLLQICLEFVALNGSPTKPKAEAKPESQVKK